MFTISRSSSSFTNKHSDEILVNQSHSQEDSNFTVDIANGTEATKMKNLPPSRTPFKKASNVTIQGELELVRRYQPKHLANPFQLPPSLDPRPLSENTVNTEKTGIYRTTESESNPSICNERSTDMNTTGNCLSHLNSTSFPVYEPGNISSRCSEYGNADTTCVSNVNTIAEGAEERNLTRRVDPTLPVGTFTVDADSDSDDNTGNTNHTEYTEDTDTMEASNVLRSKGSKGTNSTHCISKSKTDKRNNRTMRRIRFVSRSRKRRQQEIAADERLHDTMKTMNRTALAKLLTDNQLIKSGSTAPECVLRDIARGVFLSNLTTM